MMHPLELHRGSNFRPRRLPRAEKFLLETSGNLSLPNQRPLYDCARRLCTGASHRGPARM